MRKISVFLLLAFAPIGAANAQDMPLNQFLEKANALQKKGPLAVFSGDIGRLKKEMDGSFKELRAERLAAKEAGKKPSFCPPEKAKLAPMELIGHLRSIPAAQRDRMRSKDGFRSYMAWKYPCR